MGQALSPGARHEVHGVIRRKVIDLTRRVWAGYWARRAEHATIAILHSLDDRALKDIGLDRSEIESVVYGDHQGRGRRQRSTGNRRTCKERRIGMYY
jgi:uncharacterized protein YjiS (DUF1127 family)